VAHYFANKGDCVVVVSVGGGGGGWSHVIGCVRVCRANEISTKTTSLHILSLRQRTVALQSFGHLLSFYSARCLFSRARDHESERPTKFLAIISKISPLSEKGLGGFTLCD
jgi:hypothetical protein